MKNHNKFMTSSKPVVVITMALIFSVIFLAAFIQPVCAETYYVNNTAEDSVSFGLSADINTPCSPATAFENAVAGDTIYFLAGKYDTTVSTDWSPRYHAKWRPANSGTSDNPITFAANHGDLVVINGVVDSDEDEIRVFSTGSNDYIIFDGFFIQANDGTDIGSIIIGYNSGVNSGITADGCIIRNCVFNGGTKVITSTDNREAIRIEDTTNTLVENCKIYNIRQITNWHNSSAIKMCHNVDTIIQNNEIYNCSTGMYDKSKGIGTIFRYNYIHDCHTGYEVDTNYQHPDNKIYHNVFADQEKAQFFSPPGGDGPSRSDNLEFYNNTFYTGNIRANSVSLRSGTNQEFYNNLFYGMPKDGDLGMLRFVTSNGTEMTISKCDHNQFGDIDNSFQVSVYRQSINSYERYFNLADWKSSGELAGGNNPGEGTLASDPQFVNTSGNMNILSDFALKDTSPCKGTGTDGVDMGAAIESVGVNPDILPDYDPQETDPENPVNDNEGDASGSDSDGGGGCFIEQLF